MREQVRFGLAASFALHVLLIGMWRMQPSYVPAPQLHAERSVSVSLLRDQDGSGPQIASSPPIPSGPAPMQPEDAVPQVNQPQPAHWQPPESALSTNIIPAILHKDAPYIPAGQLDDRPTPASPVMVPFPETSLAVQRASGVLVLFVGSDGRVDRVEVDESDLPPDFERIAIDTFMHARMRPGMLNGQATRARMKVLVEFEQR